MLNVASINPTSCEIWGRTSYPHGHQVLYPCSGEVLLLRPIFLGDGAYMKSVDMTWELGKPGYRGLLALACVHKGGGGGGEALMVVV
jgi:hypothetical protein